MTRSLRTNSAAASFAARQTTTSPAAPTLSLEQEIAKNMAGEDIQKKGEAYQNAMAEHDEKTKIAYIEEVIAFGESASKHLASLPSTTTEYAELEKTNNRYRVLISLELTKIVGGACQELMKASDDKTKDRYFKKAITFGELASKNLASLPITKDLTKILEKEFQGAMAASDDKTKNKHFKIAVAFGELVSKNLTSLPPTAAGYAGLEETNNHYGEQIGLELPKILEKALSVATKASDEKTKLEHFKIAKTSGELVSKNLASFPPATSGYADLKKINGFRAQISLELAGIYRSQYATLKMLTGAGVSEDAKKEIFDKQIEVLKLEEKENENALEILKTLPTPVQNKVMPDLTGQRLRNQVYLSCCYSDKGRAIEKLDVDGSIEQLALAVKANDVALKMVDASDILATAKNDILWNEWALKGDLETASSTRLAQLEKHAADALEKLQLLLPRSLKDIKAINDKIGGDALLTEFPGMKEMLLKKYKKLVEISDASFAELPVMKEILLREHAELENKSDASFADLPVMKEILLNEYPGLVIKSDALLTEFQDKAKILFEAHEAYVPQLDNLQKITGELRKCSKMKNNPLWNSTSDRNRTRCMPYPRIIRDKLAMVAISNAAYKTLLSLEQLKQLKVDSSTDAHDHTANWARQHGKAIFKQAGTFRDLFNLNGEKKDAALSDLGKAKVLTSLVRQLKTRAAGAHSVAIDCTNNKMPELAKHIAALKECCIELGNAANNELKIIEAKLSRKEKKELKDTAAQQPQQQSWLLESIETKYDGTLAGRREGNFVVAKDFHGKETKYREEGNVWVRVKKDEAVDEALAEIEEKEDASEVAEQHENKLQTSTKKWEKAKGKLTELQGEIKKSTANSNYALKHNWPFSVFDAYFIEAVENQESAVEVLTDNIPQLKMLKSPSPDLLNEIKELETDLANRKTWLENAQKQRIGAAKTLPPSEPALKFLLEEGEINRVELTVKRKKLRGVIITRKGARSEDYMDEYKIRINGTDDHFVLHIHYNKKEALLEQKTKSHLKFKNFDYEDVRNEVTLETMKSLLARVGHNLR
jgi:hypothetical protein